MEGDPGTWSHCGDSNPHPSHTHSFAMNEGAYNNIPCNGTYPPLNMSDYTKEETVASNVLAPNSAIRVVPDPRRAWNTSNPQKRAFPVREIIFNTGIEGVRDSQGRIFTAREDGTHAPVEEDVLKQFGLTWEYTSDFTLAEQKVFDVFVTRTYVDAWDEDVYVIDTGDIRAFLIDLKKAWESEDES